MPTQAIGLGSEAATAAFAQSSASGPKSAPPLIAEGTAPVPPGVGGAGTSGKACLTLLGTVKNAAGEDIPVYHDPTLPEGTYGQADPSAQAIYVSDEGVEIYDSVAAHEVTHLDLHAQGLRDPNQHEIRASEVGMRHASKRASEVGEPLRSKYNDYARHQKEKRRELMVAEWLPFLEKYGHGGQREIPPICSE